MKKYNSDKIKMGNDKLKIQLIQLLQYINLTMSEFELYKLAKMYLTITDYKINFKRSKNKREYMHNFFNSVLEKLPKN